MRVVFAVVNVEETVGVDVPAVVDEAGPMAVVMAATMVVIVVVALQVRPRQWPLL